MKHVYVAIHVYYVIWLHADTHVSCNTFTWRYTCIMQYSFMKICTYYVSLKHVDIRWLCKQKSRWSGRAVGYWSWWRHQQCNVAEVTDVIATHSSTDHNHLEWTNGWLVLWAAKGLWTCCWRSATSFPDSWSDLLPRERVRSLGPRGNGVASFIGRFLWV